MRIGCGLEWMCVCVCGWVGMCVGCGREWVGWGGWVGMLDVGLSGCGGVSVTAFIQR